MNNTPHPQDFNRYPMLWIAIYFASGIAIVHVVSLSVWQISAAAVLIVALCALRRAAAFVILPLIFVPLGAACYQIETKFISSDRIKAIYSDGLIGSGEPVELEGVLLRPAEQALDGTFLTLGVERLVHKNADRTVSGSVRLFAPVADADAAGEYDTMDLGYGSRIRVMCNLEREDAFRNPGVASRIEMLDRQEVDATATIKSPKLVEKIGEDAVPLPLASIYEQRERLITAFRENFSIPVAGVLTASLLGNKNFLDRPTADLFRDGGTFHVLVISGLHITFIGGITLWFMSFFIRRGQWQYLLVASFLWAYTFAVGAEVPVVRASLMFSLFLFSRAIYRTGSLLNPFATCALLLLIWRPSDLFSASFQLTIVSVASIVGCAFPLIEKFRAIGGWKPTVDTPLPPTVGQGLRRFCEFLYWNETEWLIDNGRQIWSANLFKSKVWNMPNAQRLAAYVFEGVLVSLIVQIWMLPLLVIHFHRITPAAILLNLWVGAFLAIESFAAIAAVFMNYVSVWLSAPLISLAEFSNAAMLFVPNWIADAGFTSHRSPVYPGYGKAIYFAYAVAVGVAAIGLFKWNPFDLEIRPGRSWKMIASRALVLLLGLIVVFHPYSAPSADGNVRIDFLDVGQGDSALITFPNGKTMLVDGGGRIDFSHDGKNAFEPDRMRIGESVVSEFLWERGYSQIDYLVVTHSDADHIQGLIDVAGNFDIGVLLVGQRKTDDPQLSTLLDIAGRRSIQIIDVGDDDEFSIGGATVLFLNPPKNENSGITSANNGSVVFRIKYGSRSFLLTGDIERESEDRLVNIAWPDLDADVVKVAHHGSRTSSTENFVRATGAELAVISVGRRSRFGHPHPEVVERWANAGARVMTTGRKGTITVSTDGTDLLIATFVP